MVKANCDLFIAAKDDPTHVVKYPAGTDLPDHHGIPDKHPCLVGPFPEPESGPVHIEVEDTPLEEEDWSDWSDWPEADGESE